MAFEIEQPFERGLVVGDVRLDLVTAEKFSLLALSRGITDQSGGSPHQCEGPMTGALPVGQHLDGKVVSDRERLGGGIESAVGHTSRSRQMNGEVLRGRRMQEASPGQFFEESVHT